jgi:hypothetical protein
MEDKKVVNEAYGLVVIIIRRQIQPNPRNHCHEYDVEMRLIDLSYYTTTVPILAFFGAGSGRCPVAVAGGKGVSISPTCTSSLTTTTYPLRGLDTRVSLALESSRTAAEPIKKLSLASLIYRVIARTPVRGHPRLVTNHVSLQAKPFLKPFGKHMRRFAAPQKQVSGEILLRTEKKTGLYVLRPCLGAHRGHLRDGCVLYPTPHRSPSALTREKDATVHVSHLNQQLVLFCSVKRTNRREID